ncbi:uncharacterized protein MONBRDRAFT_32596 [Monosiga brevicollis MX1]|uniref:SWIRM domain-containing protein n=1 Tax=Monosiga brevicollis TaxID=81824 RepID=A9V0K3_MONBE|nr:uncharacterized protein MONBRDRAFT_32596 [Monosiga brevicollis MX1]EDQ89030.1 predicted protein [Monosiga brevicollis MX1]|eukprot:XP_001746135.1 hypothetical protein [Monosiga brevicollis MX1]
MYFVFASPHPLSLCATRKKERETEREKRERERKKENGQVCLCVCAREREREVGRGSRALSFSVCRRLCVGGEHCSSCVKWSAQTVGPLAAIMAEQTLRKPNGGPQASRFESSAEYEALKEVKAAVEKRYGKYNRDAGISNKALAKLISGIWSFQETYLGKASKDRAMLRLPGRFFQDYSADSPLVVIVGEALKFKADNNIRNIEWNHQRVNSNMDMMLAISNKLREEGLWPRPRIFLDSSISAPKQAHLAELAEARVHESNLHLFLAWSCTHSTCQKFQCTVTLNHKDATHIISQYPDKDPTEDDDEEYLRPVQERNGQMLAHWWYFPDSYDTWVPKSAVTGSVEPFQPRDTWVVTAWWLLHTEVYNEFMNEEDYEDTDYKMSTSKKRASQGNSRARQRSGKGTEKKKKRAASPVEDTPARKSKRDKRASTATATPEPAPEPVAEQPPPMLNAQPTGEKVMDVTQALGERERTTRGGPIVEVPDEPPRVVARRRRSRAAAAAEAEEQEHEEEARKAAQQAGDKKGLVETAVSTDDVVVQTREEAEDAANALAQAQEEAIHAKKQARELEEQMQTEDEEEQEHDATRLVEEQQHHIVIPAPAAWFDYHTIHEIEVRALPEFFNDKNPTKQPEVYMSYRNFMIDTYRLNPTQYLTVTACRRHLAGDVCAILRVHAFLEQWGLINYQVDIESRPTAMGPPSTAHFHVLAETPSGLRPIHASLLSAKSRTRARLIPTILNTTDTYPCVKQERAQKSEALLVTRALGVQSKPVASSPKSATDSASQPATSAVSEMDVDKTEAPSSTGGSALAASEKTGDDKAGASTDARGSTATGDISAMDTDADGETPGESQTKAQEGTSATIIKSEPQSKDDEASPSRTEFLLQRDIFPTVPEEGLPWTDEELLALLEAIDIYREDWLAVRDHVNNVCHAGQPKRTHDECLTAFVRLPIEDPFLKAQTSAAPEAVPFSSTANPLMMTLSFLATQIEPAVAAEAAKTALRTLGDRKLAETQARGAGRTEADEATASAPATSTSAASVASDATASEAPAAEAKARTASTSTGAGENETGGTEEEGLGVNGVQDVLKDAVPQADVEAATRAALQAAGGKALKLAKATERRMRFLAACLVETQLAKMEIKLRHFEELESQIELKQAAVQQERQALLQQRIKFEAEKRRQIEQLERGELSSNADLP